MTANGPMANGPAIGQLSFLAMQSPIMSEHLIEPEKTFSRPLARKCLSILNNLMQVIARLDNIRLPRCWNVSLLNTGPKIFPSKIYPAIAYTFQLCKLIGLLVIYMFDEDLND